MQRLYPLTNWSWLGLANSTLLRPVTTPDRPLEFVKRMTPDTVPRQILRSPALASSRMSLFVRPDGLSIEWLDTEFV